MRSIDSKVVRVDRLKLPKKIVPGRFRIDQLKVMEAADTANHQTVSDWVRAASEEVLANSRLLVQETHRLIKNSNELMAHFIRK